MSGFNTIRLVVLVSAVTVLGCAASPSERDFGNSVRHNIAQQRIPPQPAPDTDPATDGQRLENVMTLYRGMVGDPVPVVREVMVEKKR